MTVKKDFSLVCLSVEHYNTYFPALQIIFICVSLSSSGFSVCQSEVCPRDLQEYVIVVNKV